MCFFLFSIIQVLWVFDYLSLEIMLNKYKHMSKYLNDPREMAINTKIGVIYEEDNRVEKMYHWGAKILDLCGMEPEEYMKPMTVNVNGSSGGGGETPSSGETPVKRNISMKFDIISPDGNVIGATGEVIDHVEGDGNWKVRYTWDKDYNGVLASSVKVYDENNNEYLVDTYLSDNQDNKIEVNIPNVSSNIVRIGSYGIGTNPSDTSNSTVTVNDSASNVDYVINIQPSTNSYIVDYNILYGAKSKSKEITIDDLSTISLYDANDENGVNLEFTIPISQEFSEESMLHDDGEPPYDDDDTAEELWQSWKEQYQNSNRYSFRIYIPIEIENNYTYELFNNNQQETEAVIVRSNSTKTFNNVEYAEYVNEDVKYVYDDDIHTFELRFIIKDK